MNPVAGIRASSRRPYRVASLHPGVPVYTDRRYRIERVPAELRGEAFVQTANGDADF